MWDFGDGSIATGQVVTHTYATAGGYTVTLTTYSITPKGEVCECIDKCTTDIYVSPRVLENKFECGNVRKEGKTRSATSAISSSNISIKAVPNPFSEQVQISFSVPATEKAANSGHYNIDFASNNGTVLQSKTLADLNKPVSFQTNKYPSGSYIVMLKNKTGQIQSIKVIKLK